MTTYTFQSYPASVKETFDCPSCGKKNCTRTFRVECTVNPFNKNEDGTVKTPREVMRQSSQRALEAKETFLRKPLCASCEDALSFKDRQQLRADRAI